MKKRGIGSVLLSVLLGILAALVVVAVGGYFTFKLVIVPKYTKQLTEQGKGEIAQLVEENANLSSLAAFSSVLSDKNVLDFLSNINKETAKSVIDVLDSLEKDQAAEATPAPQMPVDTTWQVRDPLPKPTSTPTPKPSTPAANSQAPQQKPDTKQDAYERISAIASAEEMADGLRIISKLDMGYVSSLLADGLTKAEKSELMAYVKRTLTKSEISRALALYNAYKKYL